MVLVMVLVFIAGNLKDCLTKKLIPLKRLIMGLLHTYIITIQIIKVKFKGGCLKQNRFKFLHEEIVNVYIVYKTVNNFNVSSYPTLENCLFGTVKLTKKEHIDKYGYSNYATGFERH